MEIPQGMVSMRLKLAYILLREAIDIF